MRTPCPSCGFMLESVDASVGACPECGVDAAGRAALAHRAAWAVRCAGAALGVVASLELLGAAQYWTGRAFRALVTNAEAVAAMNGEQLAHDRARAWMTLVASIVTTIAGAIAWRTSGGRAAALGAKRVLLGFFAVVVPAVSTLASAWGLAGGWATMGTAGIPGGKLIVLLGAALWWAPLPSAACAAWLAFPGWLRRPALIGPTLWLVVATVVMQVAVGPAVPGLGFVGQVMPALAALCALAALRSWPHVHEPLPEHRSGDVVTLRHAMHLGGTVLGWALAVLGVLVWILARSRAIDMSSVDAQVTALDLLPRWMVARDVLAMVIAAAWVIPTFLVPDPRAARTWKLAALISGAAAVLFAGR